MSKNEKPEPKEYDAFISYKHSDFDKEICHELHKQLESFKLKKDGKEFKVQRVFLDSEELSSAGSLSESIQQALDKSRHLIVVCSKDTPESPWVKKEIEYFTAKHGYDKVLALLIDGEPDEAFPEPLRYADVDGVLKEVEPLAADIRAANPRQSKKALKREILRLLAPLLGMSFDDLRQRHQKMQMRRVIRIACLVVTLVLSFSLFALLQWQNAVRLNNIISDQNVELQDNYDLISAQNDELDEQNRLIMEQNRRVLSMQSQFMARESRSLLDNGNRRLALFAAREALPKRMDDPDDRPFVEDAAFALTEALGVYTHSPGFFHADAVYTLDSQIYAFAFCPEVEHIAAITSTRLTVLRLADGEVITNVPVYGNVYDFKLSFSSDGSVIYTNALNDTLAAIDVNTGNVIWESEIRNYELNRRSTLCLATIVDEDPFNWTQYLVEVNLTDGTISKYFETRQDGRPRNLSVSPCGKYYSSAGDSDLVIAGTADDSVIVRFEIEDGGRVILKTLFDSDANVAVVEQTIFLGNTNSTQEYFFYDLATGNKINSFFFDAQDRFYFNMHFLGDDLFVISEFSGFEVLDYTSGDIIDSVPVDGIRSSAVHNSVFLMALSSGTVNMYMAGIGQTSADYSFSLTKSPQEIISNKGTFAGYAGNELYIRRPYTAPNSIELERGINEAAFLDGGMMLTVSQNSISDEDAYVDLLVLSEDAKTAESISRLTLPGYKSSQFDAENKLLYYLDTDGLLHTVRVVDDSLVLEETIVVGDSNFLLSTNLGTPVLRNSKRIILNPGTPEASELEQSIGFISSVYEHSGYLVLGSYSDIEILADGESVMLSATGIRAIHPQLDEFVYYDGNELVFREFFAENDRKFDVTALGKVASLFYSPEGDVLFIGTDTRKLYAFDLDSLSFTEMAADFRATPKEAAYINGTLAIIDDHEYVTFWNPDSLKVLAATNCVVRGWSSEMMIVGYFNTSIIVPFYSMPELLDLADEILAGYVFAESDVARYR